ncbi:MAG: MBOAT family protein [Clostridiales bacterium]|nr:MBOAT family protein [Clostridiales bacterium]
MLFNSYIFVLLFLPVTLIGYFAWNHFDRYKAAKIWLTAASLVFYAYFKLDYLWIILSSILFNFALNKLFVRVKKKNIRKAVLAFGLIVNIGILFAFKYFDFFLLNLNYILGTGFSFVNLLLPLGISFFTFQQLSYLVDSYRGEVPDYGFVDYALYVTFFPQLIAGPIVLHGEIIPQFEDLSKKKFRFDNFAKGLMAFSFGMAKKVLIADVLGRTAAYACANIGSLNSVESILSILAFSFRVYFDFSGYSDMATGVGLMFNIEIPQNFDSPYKAVTIVEFWRRWNMTLNRFFLKYLYIPLGGNRGGVFKTYRNIMVVFLVSGLWHGANYNYILWGAIQGLLCIVTRVFMKQIERLPRWLVHAGNLFCVCLGWTVFFAPSIGDAFTMIGSVFTGGFAMPSADFLHTFQVTEIQMLLHLFGLLDYRIIYAVCMIGFSWFAVLFMKNTNERMSVFQPTFRKGLVTFFLLLLSILSFSRVESFVYFNF